MREADFHLHIAAGSRTKTTLFWFERLSQSVLEVPESIACLLAAANENTNDIELSVYFFFPAAGAGGAGTLAGGTTLFMRAYTTI